MVKRKITVLCLLVAVTLSWSIPTRAIYETDEVVFLPAGTYYHAVHKAINESKESVYIAMYLFKKHGEDPNHLVNILIEDLKKAKKRGVRIKVILDQTIKGFDGQSLNNDAYQVLLENGVEVKYAPSNKVFHTKLVVVDEKITFVGSHNWTLAALGEYNNEFSVMINSPKVAQSFISQIKGTPVSLIQPTMRELAPAKVQAIEASRVHLQTGCNYYNNKMYFDAIRELEAALKLDPNLVEAHYYLALSYQGRGEREKAKAKLEEIIRIDCDGLWGQKAQEAYRRLK